MALPGAGGMTDVQLEAASDAAGAMVFARPEDGAFNPVKDDEYFFVTTGDVPASGPEQGNYLGNSLGRLYSLKLNPSDPTKGATLSVVYNADEIIAAGGDIAISPDNMDTSSEYLMINEDGTGPSRPVMGAKGRDGSIWRFDLKPSGGVDASSATRVAELDPPGRNGSPPDGTRRARHLGDERHHRRIPSLRSRHVAVGRAGAPTDARARRKHGHRRGRTALPASANDLTHG